VTVREREHALGVEAARLAAVRRYGILDTPPDSAFDRVARLAARLFATPIATVTIVDEQRIWFKARHGLDGVTEIAREPGLCASAILDDEPYLVTDARVDPRTLHHSLVHGELGLRFYAAAPIVTADDHRLGTVNVIDHAPASGAPGRPDDAPGPGRHRSRRAGAAARGPTDAAGRAAPARPGGGRARPA
jgi:phosphoserine phosphatase RsbU/P